jgi:hypothetical protein
MAYLLYQIEAERPSLVRHTSIYFSFSLFLLFDFLRGSCKKSESFIFGEAQN